MNTVKQRGFIVVIILFIESVVNRKNKNNKKKCTFLRNDYHSENFIQRITLKVTIF